MQLNRHQLLIAAVAGVLLFLNLGKAELFDEDEPKNAGCGQEMLERGDWIVPTFNHDLRTDKPILLYWLMLSAYHTLGVNEFSARFWSALLGVGTSLVTYQLGRRLYGERAGLWAGLIIATSLNFDMVARAATPDSTFIFCCTLTLLAFVVSARQGVWQAGEGPSDPISAWRDFLPTTYLGYLAIYAAMSLAVLAKGPAGIVLPSCAIGLFLLTIGTASVRAKQDAGQGWRAALLRAWSWLARAFSPGRIAAVVWAMRPITGLAVLSVVALPWYLLVSFETDFAWPAGFLGRHNVGRFVQTLENHRGPIFYYLIAISVGFFPWSVFLLPCLLRWRDRLRQHFAPGDVFVACWAGFYIGFFSLAGTKLPNYVLPSYPALALLTAAMVSDWLTVAAPRPSQVALGFGTVALVGLGVTIGVVIAATILTPGDFRFTAAWIVPLAGGLLTLWLLYQRSLEAAMQCFAVLAVLQAAVLFGFSVVALSEHHTSRDLISRIRATSGSPTRIGTFEYFEPSLVYYARQRVPHFSLEFQVGEFLATGDGYLITHEKYLPRIRDQIPAGVEVLARKQRFLRRGDLLLLGRPRQVAGQAAHRVR